MSPDARTWLAKRIPSLRVETTGGERADLRAAIDASAIGTPADVPVSVPANPEPGTIATFLAVLERGGVLVPIAVNAPHSRAERTRLLIAAAPAAALPRPSTILETSGSSGTPKLVVHDLAAHRASALAAMRALDLGPDDRWLLSLPLHHVGGLAVLFRTLASGATLLLPDRGEPLAGALARARPSFVSLVATQLARLLDDRAAREALVAARVVLTGGAPVPLSLRRRAAEAGVPLVITYGSTEAASLVTAGGERHVVDSATGAGRPLEGMQIGITPGGRIRIGGEPLFAGYLTREGLGRARDRNGWFVTTDLGHIDAAGVLHVSGRDDLGFICGGENVDPIEVESVLAEHVSVAEAIVVPVADATWGRRPVAFVRLRAGPGEGAADLARHVREHLPAHARPDAIYALTGQGGAKPDREHLARIAAEGADLDLLVRLRARRH